MIGPDFHPDPNPGQDSESLDLFFDELMNSESEVGAAPNDLPVPGAAPRDSEMIDTLSLLGKVHAPSAEPDTAKQPETAGKSEEFAPLPAQATSGFTEFAAVTSLQHAIATGASEANEPTEPAVMELFVESGSADTPVSEEAPVSPDAKAQDAALPLEANPVLEAAAGLEAALAQFLGSLSAEDAAALASEAGIVFDPAATEPVNLDPPVMIEADVVTGPVLPDEAEEVAATVEAEHQTAIERDASHDAIPDPEFDSDLFGALASDPQTAAEAQLALPDHIESVVEPVEVPGAETVEVPAVLAPVEPDPPPETAASETGGAVDDGSIAEDAPLTEVLAAIDSSLAAPEPGGAPAEPESKPAVDAHQTCIVFQLRGSAYGIRIGSVLEMDTVPRITPVPNVPEFVSGVANLRGEILPVLNLGTMLGLEQATTAGGRILVVRTSRSEQTAVLLVDEVRGTTPVAFHELEQPGAQLSDEIVPLLFGVGVYQQQVLNVLDLDRVFEVPAVRSLRG